MKTLNRIKQDPRVQDAWSEMDSGDGYWINLKAGWRSICTECHMVHEWTIKALLADFRDIEPCDCDECTRDLASLPSDELKNGGQ